MRFPELFAPHLPLLCCELCADVFRVSVCCGLSVDDVHPASPVGLPSRSAGPSWLSTVDHGAEAQHYAAARRSPSSVGVPVESSDPKHEVSAGSFQPTSARLHWTLDMFFLTVRLFREL